MRNIERKWESCVLMVTIMSPRTTPMILQEEEEEEKFIPDAVPMRNSQF